MNKKLAFCIAAVLVLAGAGYWHWSASGVVTAQSASVEGGIVSAEVSVPGVVKDVYVSAGDIVVKDQPLLALESSGYEARLARERAALAEVAASLPPSLLVASPTAPPAPPGKPLEALRTEEEDARRRAEIAAHEYAAANIAFSRLDARSAGHSQPDPGRQAALVARDEAALALQAAKAAHEKASYARAQKEAKDKVERMNGAVPAALAARIAEYRARISRVRLAEQDIANTLVLAPETGRVLLVAAGKGDSLSPGDAPVAVAPEKTDNIWVTAFFALPDAEKLVPGQECEVTLEGQSVSAAGRIGRIMPGEGEEKELAVRVILDKDGLPESFTPGRSVSVSVRTGGKSFLSAIKKSITKN